MRTKVIFLLLSCCFCRPVPAQDRDTRLPDSKLTRGHAVAVTAADLCEPDYKHPARKIPITLKRQVFDRYRIPGDKLGYHIDHLIPVQLGGSNSIANLWPQPLSGEWCWQRKRHLEGTMRQLVCRGQLDLKNAQREIAADWIGAYKKYAGEARRARSKQP